MKVALNRALRLVRRTVDEWRPSHGLHTAAPARSSLERAVAHLLRDMTTERVPRLRMFVQGKPVTLNPPIEQQLFLIVRDAATNALRHSRATKIEVEVQYRHNTLRVVVRDNGCGINPEAVQKKSDSHQGLRGMRDQAEKIGARFGIWSRPGIGTQVCVVVPDIAKRRVSG